MSAYQVIGKLSPIQVLTRHGFSGSGGVTNETALCGILLPDMRNRYTTVAMRRAFQVTSNLDSNFHLILTMDWDDGFVAFLDGTHLVSFFSPGAPEAPAR
ncbi:MAG: hypothetical protein L0Y58_17665 [Verrucomicrobia subdivision 3 bacterium]|nr:hypothetical protein [Limisphaerales bacterium]